MAEPGRVAAELVYSPAPRQLWRWAGTVPAGATVADVIAASGVLAAHAPMQLVEAPSPGGGDAARAARAAGIAVSLWGRRCRLAEPVRERDRVELSRELRVDPKEARRQRYAQHRERRATPRQAGRRGTGDAPPPTTPSAG